LTSIGLINILLLRAIVTKLPDTISKPVFTARLDNFRARPRNVVQMIAEKFSDPI